MYRGAVTWFISVGWHATQSEAFRDLFFDEEFPGVPFKKNFEHVWVEKELWEWFEGPLLNGMFVSCRSWQRVVGAASRGGAFTGCAMWVATDTMVDWKTTTSLALCRSDKRA